MFPGSSQPFPVRILATVAILAVVTNMYAPGGPGAPSDGQPAEPIAPYGQPQHNQTPRGGRGRGKLAALIVTCAVVAGGAFAVTEAVSGPGAGQPAAATAADGPTGQAAVLNGVLADAEAASPPATPAADGAAAAASAATPSGGTVPAATSPAGRAALRRLHRALIRLRRLGGMYGQYTFETKNGPRTLAFERGTVLSVTGSAVTVKATDGTTWTWVLSSTSVLRENGARTTVKSLAAGQTVFTAGPVTGTTRDTRLVVIRAAAKG